jgi:hypothetical protein
MIIKKDLLSLSFPFFSSGFWHARRLNVNINSPWVIGRFGRFPSVSSSFLLLWHYDQCLAIEEPEHAKLEQENGLVRDYFVLFLIVSGPAFLVVLSYAFTAGLSTVPSHFSPRLSCTSCSLSVISTNKVYGCACLGQEPYPHQAGSGT